MRYFPMGGINYADPDCSEESDEGYETLGEAAYEWKRRRNDWTGRFPCWGDGQEPGSGRLCVILADETEVRDGWTIEEIITDPACEELTSYYDMPSGDDNDDEA